MSTLQRMFALLLALAVLAGVVTTCLFIVDQRQYAMVYGAGQLPRLVQEPGLQFKWPWPLQKVRTLDRRTLLAAGDTGQQPIVLADDRQVPLAWHIQWRITQPEHYTRQVGGSVQEGEQVLHLSTASIMQAIGKRLTWQQLQQQQYEALPQELKKRLNIIAQSAEKPWGLEVLDVRLTRVDIKQAEAEAAQARMNAALLQTAAQLKSEAASAAAAARMQAEEQRQALLAEGQRQAQQIRGEGDVQAMRIYAADHAQNPQLAGFLRTLAVYRKSFGGAGDVLVIDPASNSFLQQLRAGSAKLPSLPASTPMSAASSASATHTTAP